MSLHDQAMVLRAEGRQPEALERLRDALAISRETGISFVGPWLLGHLAAVTEDAVERHGALAEGEEVLRKGSVGHNHLWFYRYAVEASLRAGEWAEAERYAAALEDYTRPEPLPWAAFLIAYGRVLSAHGCGRRDHGTLCELRRVRGEAERFGLRAVLPAIEHALTAG